MPVTHARPVISGTIAGSPPATVAAGSRAAGTTSAGTVEMTVDTEYAFTAGQYVGDEARPAGHDAEVGIDGGEDPAARDRKPVTQPGEDDRARRIETLAVVGEEHWRAVELHLHAGSPQPCCERCRARPRSSG